MRYLFAAAVIVVLFASPAGAQSRDQNWAWCEEGDPARGIKACTDLIESGRETVSNLAIAYSNRGINYSDKGDFGRAIADYEQALELKPDLAPAMNSLAWDLATMPSASLRSGPRAVELAERALAFNQREPGFLDTLAAAYAEAGRFTDAVRSQETAIELLRQAGNVPAPVIEDFESRLQLYQNDRPFHRPQ
jgi:tetratricopeptide (TPR) repeat protein